MIGLNFPILQVSKFSSNVGSEVDKATGAYLIDTASTLNRDLLKKLDSNNVFDCLVLVLLVVFD